MAVLEHSWPVPVVIPGRQNRPPPSLSVCLRLRARFLGCFLVVLLLTCTSCIGHFVPGERPALGEWTTDDAAVAELEGREYLRSLEEAVVPSSSMPSATPSTAIPSTTSNNKGLNVSHIKLLLGSGNGELVQPILVYTPSPVFKSVAEGWWCGSVVRDLVFHPNGTEFYFILDEYCNLNETVQRRRISFRKADLELAHLGLKDMDQHTLLSYWWPESYDVDDLSPSQRMPLIFEANSQTKNVSMTLVLGLDLSKQGDKLIMGASTLDARSGNPSKTSINRIVSMTTTDGGRTSVTIPANFVWSVAFNPTKTHLYLSDAKDPVRILSTEVNSSGMPINPSNWTLVRSSYRINGNSDDDAISHIGFGDYSFTPNERCLYFVESGKNRVWGVDPLSPPSSSFSENLAATLVAGSGREGSRDDDGVGSSFRSLGDIVATPDGCNVFVTQFRSGRIRWLKLDSPCSTARRVETIATHADHGLWGLALRKTREEDLILYVGASDGSVFELKIDRSQLHRCGDGTMESQSLPDEFLPPGSAGLINSPPESSSGGNLALVLSVTAFVFLLLGACLGGGFAVYKARRRAGSGGQGRFFFRLTSET